MIMQDINNLMDKILEFRKQMKQINYDLYMHHILFSFKWWVILFIVILLLFIWWKLVDKKRFPEIALTGFVTAIITAISDNIGLEMVLWAHPLQLFGLIRNIHELELVIVPISFMLLYQYFVGWKKYIIAVTTYAIFAAYIIIPFSVRFGTYKIINWKYTYSFVVFIIMGIMIKFIVEIIMSVPKRYIIDADK
jgi:hypothetical protein